MDTKKSRLWRAVKNVDLSLAKSLLRSDKTRRDINSKNNFEQTPLIYLLDSSVETPDKTKLLTLLLTCGADVNMVDNRGDTALHYLIQHDRLSCLDLMLDTPIDVNIQNNEGVTALSVAAITGNCAAAEKLLLKGADPNLTSIYGNTALSYVTGSSFDTAEPEKMVRLLLSYGANPNVESANGPILFDAIYRRNANITEQLLKAGVNANSCDSEGYTILMKAVRVGSCEIVSLLLSAGADIDMKNREGKTALNLAEEYKHQNVVDLLKTHTKKLNEQYCNGVDLNYF